MGKKARILRLENDHKALMNIHNKSRYISIEPLAGRPPYKYLITYKVNGYVNQSGDTRSEHHVEMFQPEGYPINDPPVFTFRESIWHPNVYSNGDVCLGLSSRTWNFGYDIDQLIYDVGNMIRFAPISLNLNSLAQIALEKSGWKSWIDRHAVPLADIDFNVSDTPLVTIKKGPKKPNIKIISLKNPIKIKFKSTQ